LRATKTTRLSELDNSRTLRQLNTADQSCCRRSQLTQLHGSLRTELYKAKHKPRRRPTTVQK